MPESVRNSHELNHMQYLIPPPAGYPQNIEELLCENDGLIFEAEYFLDELTGLLDVREAA